MASSSGKIVFVIACGFAAASIQAKGPWTETRAGAAGSKDRQAEASAPADTSGRKVPVRKEEVTAGLRRDLDTLGRRIDELKRRTAKAGAEAKRETQEDLQALERAKDKASLRLDTLGRETSAGWENLKDRTSREVDSLKASVDRLRKKIKK
jgi:hypothetical protein